MEIKGEHEFQGQRELLYELLLDPDVLAGALPGVEGTSSGRVEVLEQSPPESYRLRIDGSGKPGGVRADARVELVEAGGITTMHYRADVKARGTIARLGGRLLGGVARLLIGQFFKSIERQVDDRAA